MRCPNASVPILDLDRKSHGVADAVPTPSRPDAALDRPQSLAVRVSALEAAFDERLPDVGQVGLLRPEHVDTLAAGDLRVETVLLGDLADDDETFGRDFAARHSRDDAEGAVTLDVGHEAVVRVLELVKIRLHDVTVEERGEDAADCRLAGLAADCCFAVFAGAFDDLLPRLELLDPASVRRISRNPDRGKSERTG